jgi:hypothetical protein
VHRVVHAFGSDHNVRHHVKTQCLSPIQTRDAAVTKLDALLPGQSKPWLLKDVSGDVMAYFDLDDVDIPGVFTISADISGRYYNCDAEVVSLLERLRADLGGEITNDA